MKTICFDLDGVLCTQVEGNYEEAVPNPHAINLANQLYDKGHRIVIYTARFMGRTGEDTIETYKQGYAFTEAQLKGWGVKFHALFMGKPRYDVVIDDRALFFEEDWEEIQRRLSRTVS